LLLVGVLPRQIADQFFVRRHLSDAPGFLLPRELGKRNVCGHDPHPLVVPPRGLEGRAHVAPEVRQGFLSELPLVSRGVEQACNVLALDVRD